VALLTRVRGRVRAARTLNMDGAHHLLIRCTDAPTPRDQVEIAPATIREDVSVPTGFGRVVISETGAPNTSENLVRDG
jgi:hypothetical protein